MESESDFVRGLNKVKKTGLGIKMQKDEEYLYAFILFIGSISDIIFRFIFWLEEAGTF